MSFRESPEANGVMSNEVATPAKRSRFGLLIWVIVAPVVIAGGAAVPWLLPAKSAHDTKAKHAPAEAHDRPSAVTFGDVVVNLGEERLTRYLRVKILLVVEEAESREFTELLGKRKAFLKSWLIGYLADQSLKEVSRAAGVNRIRREVRDQFNSMLYADGSEKILDVLFDEFVVQ
jgi:flagellar basal body-associated protein FliL